MSDPSVSSPTPVAIRAQLHRILENPLFAGARRQSRFLEFVVGRSIEGQADEIKEYVIAVEVYERSPSYDPKDDSIVRAEASRLRARLREYYDTAGRSDPIRIELPKGSYTPVFRSSHAAPIAGSGSPFEPAHRELPWRWIAAGAALTALAAIAVLWGTLRAPGRTPFIAVITPANLGLDRTNDSLGEALADGITSALVDSAEWKVVGRAPALDQTGHDQMLAWVQKNLHADLVLTGNYRVGENSEVRISLQLVRVDDGSLMWTHTDHRRLAYLAESQKELARAIVAEITEKAQHAGKRRPATPANEPARRFYARARDLWSTHSDPGLIQSMALFREASQADPGFAPAWAGLADANVELVQRSREPLEPRTANARAAALRALALDDRNAEAHLVLGWILSYKDWNFQEGAQHLQWAVTLDPIRVFPNIYYSQVLTILGDFAEAQAAVEAARARLPPIPEVLFQQGSVFFLARQYAKLEALGRELVALEPNAALGHWLIGLSLEQRGRVSQAIDEFQSGLQESPRDLRTLCALSHAYGLAGAKAKAMETMRLFLDPDRKELTQYTLSYCAALTYASVGRKDEAFEWLEKARAGHDASFPFLPYDPRFDPLKNDTRFKPLADSIRNRGNL